MKGQSGETLWYDIQVASKHYRRALWVAFILGFVVGVSLTGGIVIA